MHNYVRELELLILDTLLPVYIKYQKAHGDPKPLRQVHPDLLRQIKTKTRLPALLREKSQ